MADARSRKSLGNPDAKALLERVAVKGQCNYKHIRSGHNGGAVEKFCNTTASHFAFPNQYNSSITYFLKIAVFLENERAEKKKQKPPTPSDCKRRLHMANIAADGKINPNSPAG